MDDLVEEYRRHAQSCRRMADDGGPISGNRLLGLAEMWDKLADEREAKLRVRPEAANENIKAE